MGLDLLTQGGYTMLAILAASIAALTEVLYCFLVLRRRVVLAPALLSVAEGRGEAADPDAAAAICKREGGPFAEILRAVLASRRAPLDEAESMVEGAGRRAAHTLSRSVIVLEVVAAVAPLLGLLGTVIGMHEVFNQIADAGTKEIGTLSAGIGKALVTTISGLIVAIPAYIFYSYFQRRVDDLIIEMERYAAQMMARLRKDAA
jgi:biopolymer transport protein ExbB